MIVPTRFGHLLVVQREDFHRTVWAEFQWLRLSLARRLWLRVTGRRAAALAHFRTKYLDFESRSWPP